MKDHISHVELAMAVRSAGKVYLNMSVIEANLITWEVAFSCIVPMNTFCLELLSPHFERSFTSLARVSVHFFLFSFVLIYIIAVFIPLHRAKAVYIYNNCVMTFNLARTTVLQLAMLPTVHIVRY